VNSYPAGIEVTPPQVLVTECQDCGEWPCDGYQLHLPADNYLSGLRDFDWDVVDDRVLCIDCVDGRCRECERPKGTDPTCTECWVS